MQVVLYSSHCVVVAVAAELQVRSDRNSLLVVAAADLKDVENLL